MSDWIEWNGGECPVDGDALVCVKLRCEIDEAYNDEWYDECIAYDLRWGHTANDNGSDIIAYRIVEGTEQ